MAWAGYSSVIVLSKSIAFYSVLICSGNTFTSDINNFATAIEWIYLFFLRIGHQTRRSIHGCVHNWSLYHSQSSKSWQEKPRTCPQCNTLNAFVMQWSPGKLLYLYCMLCHIIAHYGQVYVWQNSKAIQGLLITAHSKQFFRINLIHYVTIQALHA